MANNLRHFLRMTDLTSPELRGVIMSAARLKHVPRRQQLNLLPGMSMGMIFEKPSLRTHTSFETGMTQLGGHGMYLGPENIGLGQREPIVDVSRVLSSMVDVIIARVFKHSTVSELAAHSTVPVINALCDQEHPCQAVADMLTLYELKGRLDNSLTLAFVGDGNNNVTHSLALACAQLGVNFAVASPAQHAMDPAVRDLASSIASEHGSTIMETTDANAAVAGADAVYTDTFVSMGQEDEMEARLKEFEGYQVTAKMMTYAKDDAIFMHDMPGM
jgi:ornithine carbamoyltransferase